MTEQVRIIGTKEDCARLADTVDAWTGAVAKYLGLPAPEGSAVWIHRRPGVSWTGADGVHLLDSWRGEPDVDRLPHELVHLVAGPSPSRLLAEGLAVHVADRLSLAGAAWPCYRLDPDSWVVALRQRGRVPSVARLTAVARTVRLADLVGAGADAEEAGGAAWELYVQGASFVDHLLRTNRRDTFWAWYRAGSIGDEETLQRLEQSWLDALPSVLDEDCQARLAASLEDAAAELASASAVGST